MDGCGLNRRLHQGKVRMKRPSLAVTARFVRSWTVDAGTAEAFVRCSGDTNPLHVDDAYAQAKGHRGRLMHGALLNAFLSGFVGTGLPVKDTMCLMQKLNYRAPFFIGDEIRLEAMVTDIQPAPWRENFQIVEFGVVFRRDKEIVASGLLQVLAGEA